MWAELAAGGGVEAAGLLLAAIASRASPPTAPARPTLANGWLRTCSCPDTDEHTPRLADADSSPSAPPRQP
ncbi:hypothetical protein ABK046_43325 [Streptomyces caeruleatus]